MFGLKKTEEIFKLENELDKKIEELQAVFGDIESIKLKHLEQQRIERELALRKEEATRKIERIFSKVGSINEMLEAKEAR